MAVSETIFVDVVLKVLGRYAMMHPINRVLDLRPKAFNRVGVRIAVNVDLLTMRHALMHVALLHQFVIDRKFIGMDGRTLLDIGFNERQYGLR